MSWLDKLLGREKSEAQDASVRDEGRSDIDAAEERVAEERDESLGTQGPVPPGTG